MGDLRELDAIASSATASHASLRAALIEAVAEVRRLREAVREMGQTAETGWQGLRSSRWALAQIIDRAREVLGEEDTRWVTR